MVQRHQASGLLVDTNLLVLFFVGSFDRAQVGRFKRTRAYAPEDFDLLTRFMGLFQRIVTTPHMLAEVNSLTGQLRSDRPLLFTLIAARIGVLDERYLPSAMAAAHEAFRRVGLTDTITLLVARREYLVLTDDFELAGVLGKSGVDAINFNHIRTRGWSSG
jgi:hypothetical protein